MELFTIELVSNLSAQLFPDNTLSSFTNLLPEQMKLEGQWEVAISEKSYPSMYQNVTEGKFSFFDSNKTFGSSENSYLEPGQYPSITDNVEAMNTLIQERHNHIVNLLKRNLQSVKRNRDRFLNQGSTARLKKNNLEAKKRPSGFRKRFIAHKLHYSSRH